MRPLSDPERRLIQLLATKLDTTARERLLHDVSAAQVVSEAAGGAVLTFELAGYARPEEPGQHLYPVEGQLGTGNDIVTILLYADANDRLLELEFINWTEALRIDSSWRDLRIW